MTDTPRPWDSLTTDSAPAYEAFAAYLDTGSLRDAYRQRSGNEKATPSPRRDSQSARRHAAIREQRQRLREHLIQPGVLERHQVRALHLRLAPKFLQLRGHVVPGRAGRDIRDLLHRPFDAHTVLVGVHLRPFLGQLLRDRPVARPANRYFMASRRRTARRSACPFGRGGAGFGPCFRLRGGGLGSGVRRLPFMAFRQPLGLPAREVFPPCHRHVNVGGLDLDGVDDLPRPTISLDSLLRAGE